MPRPTIPSPPNPSCAADPARVAPRRDAVRIVLMAALLLIGLFLLSATTGCGSRPMVEPPAELVRSVDPPAPGVFSMEARLAELEAELASLPDDPNLAQTDPTAAARAARLRYYLSVNDRLDLIDPATASFEALLAAGVPTEASHRTYLGSLKLLRASEFDVNPLPNVIAGLREMDRGVNLDPENIEARFVRARTRKELPGLFNGSFNAEAEFAWLADRVEAASREGLLSGSLAANALHHHGVYRQKAGATDEAIDVWRRSIAIAPRSIGAAYSRNTLRKVGASEVAASSNAALETVD